MNKDTLRDFIPPILWRLFRKLWLASGRKEWEYIPEGWAYAQTKPEVKGWNVVDILKIYQKKWPKFVALTQGTGPLGITHESDLSTTNDITAHNVIMSFAFALALAAHHLETLSILDWGGGIGHYYLLAKVLLPDVYIDYHCKDMPVLAEYGAQLFPAQHFYTDESCLEQKYDFVLASGSLHYTEDWQTLLSDLARSTRRYLYITNLPTVVKSPSFVFVQRPYRYGYNTEYLGWCLNRDEFLACAGAAGLKLVREFIVGHQPVIYKAPEQNGYRGFLFQPVNSK